MAKTITDISFSDLLPESIKNDPTILAAAQALDGEIQAVNTELEKPLLHGRIDELPEDVVEHLAWQFHVDFWEPSLSLAGKRGLIEQSIAWHKRKGTPWAVKHLLDKAGFSDAQLIEFRQARQEYDQAGGSRLDGSWVLDGNSRLVPYETIAGLPYMKHWAEFCVKLNLAHARWPGWEEDLAWAVNVAKPARSWPVWLFWVYLQIYARPGHEYNLHCLKEIPIGYPWCTPQLNGGWNLGSGGYPYKLNGGLLLNGTWDIGGRSATVAHEQLRQCNIFFDLALQKEIDRPARHITASLGENNLFLNGGWQVGRNPFFALSEAALEKEIQVEQKTGVDWVQRHSYEIDFPMSPARLTRYNRLVPWNRVNSGWKAGGVYREMPLDGSWRLARRWVAAVGEQKLTSSSYAGMLKRLTGGRLDGSWGIGSGDVQAKGSLFCEKVLQADCHADTDTEKVVRCKYELSYPESKRLDRNVHLAGNNGLDGSWGVGTGVWKIGLNGWSLQREQSIPATSALTGTIEMAAGLPVGLGRHQRLSRKWRRRLDGHFSVAAYSQLDGTWDLNAERKLSAPKIGEHHWGLDGSWKVGAATKKLNGWSVGYDFGPSTEFELKIN